MVNRPAQFETSLDHISRKFVHRHNEQPPQGYRSLVELGADVDSAVRILLSLDPTSAPRPAYSEFWIRVTSDYVSYIEDWPLTAVVDREAIVASISAVSGLLNAGLVARARVFTQTQRTRLLSLALRARQATQEQLFSETVDAFGETLGQ